MVLVELTTVQIVCLVILSVIQLTLTGLVLWRSARRKEKAWFVFFFLVHTIIIEIIYLTIKKESK